MCRTRRAITPDLAPEPFEDEASIADEPDAGPQRRCIVTRARLPKEAMIRFVIGPDRSVVPDLAARLPGRGIWLSAQGDVIETARIRGAFAKAARGPVTVPPDLTSGLQGSLELRIGEFLGLARRAGQAVCGFQKAREWLMAGRAGLVVEASDGSAAERARFLGRHADATAGDAASGDANPRAAIRVIAPLDGARLGAVFGRDHVVHVAIARGRLAERIAMEAGRLAGVSARGSLGEPSARPKGRVSKVQADQ